MRSRLILLALIGFASATAAAANNFYLTGKLGNTSLSSDYGKIWTQSVSGDDDSWTFGGGFQLGDHFALQAEYHDFGQAQGAGSPCHDRVELCVLVVSPIEADSTAVSISALPQLPLGERLRLYGKLGVMSWDTDLYELREGRRRITGLAGEDLLYGGGGRLQLRGPLSAFAEYERIRDGFETLSFGMNFRF